MSKTNSVRSRLKEENPTCVQVRCICHSLALRVQNAFKKLTSHISYLLLEIPNWFTLSALRWDQFEQLARARMLQQILHHLQTFVLHGGWEEAKLYTTSFSIGHS